MAWTKVEVKEIAFGYTPLRKRGVGYTSITETYTGRMAVHRVGQSVDYTAEGAVAKQECRRAGIQVTYEYGVFSLPAKAHICIEHNSQNDED